VLAFWLVPLIWTAVVALSAPAKQRNEARRALGEYQRKAGLSLELRRLADVIGDDRLSLWEGAIAVGSDPVRLGLDTRTDAFQRLTEACANLIGEAGLVEEAERFRFTEEDGRLVPPAATAQGRIDHPNDLINVMAQYRQSLVQFASEQIRDLPE
jgi:hypothetical protein